MAADTQLVSQEFLLDYLHWENLKPYIFVIVSLHFVPVVLYYLTVQCYFIIFIALCLLAASIADVCLHCVLLQFSFTQKASLEVCRTGYEF